MNLAQVLGGLPAVSAVPGDEQGTWLLFICHDCQATHGRQFSYCYGDIQIHLGNVHGMSLEDANTYVTFLLGGPREVRRMNSQRVEVVA